MLLLHALSFLDGTFIDAVDVMPADLLSVLNLAKKDATAFDEGDRYTAKCRSVHETLGANAGKAVTMVVAVATHSKSQEGRPAVVLGLAVGS